MDTFIGSIYQFGGDYAPKGFALCDGHLLPISDFQALFSILGTTYGGDGVTTFALPDLRGRTAIHAGHAPALSNYDLGKKGGSEYYKLTKDTMPAHVHGARGTLNVNKTSADTSTDPKIFPAPSSGLDSSGAATVNLYGAGDVNGASDSIKVELKNTGADKSVDNMQPFQCVSWIICTRGAFPARS